jgi:hypothetical protein
MRNITRARSETASQEIITRLINAGYLQPAPTYDPVAVAKAIGQMKLDLRRNKNEDGGPKAA